MSCKVCYREYEDRPNDLCSNYLHWQTYAYQLEINGRKPSFQWSEHDVMPQINGKSFHCDCGCNVFRRELNSPRYKCNACEDQYVSGETDE
jgi:hypothetical protein